MTIQGVAGLEVIRNALDSVTDVMSVTLVNTARSPIVRQGWDFSTAILTPEGELVGQGLSQPLHLAGMIPALQACLDYYGDNVHPGDVLINNDPYEGGSHLPDIYLFKPIYLGETLVAYLAAMAHQVDIGGRMPGGQSPDSTEIYQEGLRIPPLKLFQRGESNETLFRVIEKAVRTPELVLADLRAQIAALEAGETELIRSVRRYGIEDFRIGVHELVEYTERMTRQAIKAMPNGTWSFTDILDNDGITDDTIYLVCNLTIQDDEIKVDFSGSSPQSRGAIQGIFSSMKGMVYIVLKSLLGDAVPNTSGLFRPVTVTAPEGSIVNPTLPAAVAARYLMCRLVTHAMWGAFAQAVPDRVMACPGGSMATTSFSGYDKQIMPPRAWILLDAGIGPEIAVGGRPDKDGIDAQCANVTQLANIPAEILEMEFPLRIEEHALVPDTEGAGKFRGGLGLARQWSILSDETLVQQVGDRSKRPPWGIEGGGSAAPPRFTVTDPDGIRTIPGKHNYTVNRGDVVRAQVSGAGGYGDPLERDPQQVLWDVIEEKVTLQRAKDAYGVVIDTTTRTVDRQATEQLRQSLRNAPKAEEDT